MVTKHGVQKSNGFTIIRLPPVLAVSGLEEITEILGHKHRSRSMVEVDEVVEDHSVWLHFASAAMSQDQWEVAEERPQARLSHRSCPWGGHLIKIEALTLGKRSEKKKKKHQNLPDDHDHLISTFCRFIDL